MLYSLWEKRLRRLNTSQHDYKLPNNEIHTTVYLDKNNPFADMAFWNPQNSENQPNETLQKSVQNWWIFEIWIRQVSTITGYLYSLWEDKALQFKHIISRLWTSVQHNIYYLVWLGINNSCSEKAFSGHQIMKMNIIKHSRNKYRTNDFCKIWIRQVCTIARSLCSL